MGADQQFCLRWNNFHTNITSAFESLRDDEDFVDITLACDGRQVKAHKMVLSACSPYFRSLLRVSIKIKTLVPTNLKRNLKSHTCFIFQVRQHSFSRMIPENWNQIPPHVVRTPSVPSFKLRLDRLWFKKPGAVWPNP